MPGYLQYSSLGAIVAISVAISGPRHFRSCLTSIDVCEVTETVMDQELIILGPSSSGELSPEEGLYDPNPTLYTTALTHPEDHNLTSPDPLDEDPALEGPSLLDCDWGLIRAPGNGSGDPFKLGSGAVGSGPFARIRS